MKTVDIKGKAYVMIHERIKHFRSEFKDYSMESEIISHDNGKILIKAVIKDKEGRVLATGMAQEKEGDGFINKTSYVENCETSAWGRALGNLGIGIDTSIASAEEVQNAIHNQQSKPAPKYSNDLPWLNPETQEWKTIEVAIENGQLTTVDQITKFKLSKKTKELLEKLLKI